jgi:hypothetical protein
MSLIPCSPPTASDIADKVSNLDAVLGEVLSVRIDNDQLNNATVKALTINDLVGETLEHYGEAVGHEESNETSESDHNSTASESTASNSSAQIVNEAPYQTAQALSSRIIEFFNDVKSGALNSTASGSIQTGLESLKSNIDKKASFDTLDHLVDKSITPTLNSAYDLKLKMEEED